MIALTLRTSMSRHATARAICTSLSVSELHFYFTVLVPTYKDLKTSVYRPVPKSAVSLASTPNDNHSSSNKPR